MTARWQRESVPNLTGFEIIQNFIQNCGKETVMITIKNEAILKKVREMTGENDITESVVLSITNLDLQRMNRPMRRIWRISGI